MRSQQRQPPCEMKRGGLYQGNYPVKCWVEINPIDGNTSRKDLGTDSLRAGRVFGSENVGPGFGDEMASPLR